MSLDDATYNAFAQGLVEQVSRRALGLDAASARLVDTRPADHILAGFLTPQHRPKEARCGARDPDAPDGMGAPDGSAAGTDDDLPKDSAYEQSALGLEWLIDRTAARGERLTVHVGCVVYVRRLPTFAEQGRGIRWSRVRKEGDIEQAPTGTLDELLQMCAEMRHIWHGDAGTMGRSHAED